MSRFGTIARRTFLIGSAAILGGVAFGVYQVKKPIPNPLAGTQPLSGDHRRNDDSDHRQSGP